MQMYIIGGGEDKSKYKAKKSEMIIKNGKMFFIIG